LDALRGAQAKKITWVLQLIEEMERIPAQYLKKLDGSEAIWEVRTQVGSDAFRLLGFLDKGELVLCSGFRKKTQKIPRHEIDTAERRRHLYIERKRHRE